MRNHTSRLKGSSYLTWVVYALLIGTSFCTPVAEDRRRHNRHEAPPPPPPTSLSGSLSGTGGPTGTPGAAGTTGSAIPTNSNSLAPSLSGNAPPSTGSLGPSGPTGSGPTGTGSLGATGPPGPSGLGPTGTSGLGPSGTGSLGPPGSGSLGPTGSGSLGPTGSGSLGPTDSGSLGPTGTDSMLPTASGTLDANAWGLDKQESSDGGDTGTGTAGVATSTAPPGANNAFQISTAINNPLPTAAVQPGADTAGEAYDLPPPVPALQRIPHDGNGTVELQFQRNNMSIHLGMKEAQWRAMYLANQAANANFSGRAHILEVMGAGLTFIAGTWAVEKLWSRYKLTRTLDKWHKLQDTKFLDDPDMDLDWGGRTENEIKAYKLELRSDVREFNKFRKKQMKMMEKRAAAAEDELKAAKEGGNGEEIAKAERKVDRVYEQMDRLEKSKFNTDKMEKLIKRQHELQEEIEKAKEGPKKEKLLREQQSLEEDMRRGGFEVDAKTGLTTAERKEMYAYEFDKDGNALRRANGGEFSDLEKEISPEEKARLREIWKRREKHLEDGKRRTRLSKGQSEVEAEKAESRGAEAGGAEAREAETIAEDAEGKGSRFMNKLGKIGEKVKQTGRWALWMKEDGNSMNEARFDKADMRRALEDERLALQKEIDIAEHGDSGHGIISWIKGRWKKTFTFDKELNEMKAREKLLSRRLERLGKQGKVTIWDSKQLYEESKLDEKIAKYEKEYNDLTNDDRWWRFKKGFWADRRKTQSEELHKKIEGLKEDRQKIRDKHFQGNDKVKREDLRVEQEKKYRDEVKNNREKKKAFEDKHREDQKFKEEYEKESEARKQAKAEAREKAKAGTPEGGDDVGTNAKDFAEEIEDPKWLEQTQAFNSLENTLTVNKDITMDDFKKQMDRTIDYDNYDFDGDVKPGNTRVFDNEGNFLGEISGDLEHI